MPAKQLPYTVDCVYAGLAPVFVVVDRNKNVLCTCDRREGEDTNDRAKKRAAIICEILNRRKGERNG